MIADDVKHERRELVAFECRDLGYGVESGEVYVPAFAGPDWSGKRAYLTVWNTVAYLFDDEIVGGV